MQSSNFFRIQIFHPRKVYANMSKIRGEFISELFQKLGLQLLRFFFAADFSLVFLTHISTRKAIMGKDSNDVYKNTCGCSSEQHPRKIVYDRIL